MSKYKGSSIIFYFEQFDSFAFYHQNNIYTFNNEGESSDLEEYLKSKVKPDKVKNFQTILGNKNNNGGLDCVYMNYYIFLAIINRNIKLKSVKKIIKNIEEEIKDFVIYNNQLI